MLSDVVKKGFAYELQKLKAPLSGPERTFTSACTDDVDRNKFNDLLFLDIFQLQTHAPLTALPQIHASPPVPSRSSPCMYNN